MIFHFYSAHPGDAATVKRQSVARQTWAAQSWQDCPVHDSDLRRFFREDEGVMLPFLRDIFNFACSNRCEGDIGVYTNADICVSSDCCARIEAQLENRSACYAFRRDFPRLDDPLRDDAIPLGNDYCGSDLFAFRVGWWLNADFPDMVIGREAWDAVMRVLIEETNPVKPNSLPNLIYHERHNSKWENPVMRYFLGGQLHNLRLAKDWLLRRNINPIVFGIR